ncbi:MAG: TM2 domain-containing protein [Bacilli bacterium]|nr:TM2 domain-containing protein [Bacilli bacterium]
MAKFCENCGTELNEHADVCLGCGKAVNKREGVSNPISGGYKGNKTAYCLLAFFLGGIGVHKFYIGKVGTGLLYLFFCWTFIPGILAFIDFIIGLCKNSDEYGNIWFN